MKVYIEIVILDNLVATSCIAALSYASLGIRVSVFRTALAAISGTIVSLSYPYWNMPIVLVIIARLAIGCALGVILFLGLEKTVVGVLVFLLQTCLVGGICYFAAGFFAGGERAYIPYALPSCVAALAFFGLRGIIRLTSAKRTQAGYKYDVAVTIRGRTAAMKGYLDTGNSLSDDVTRLPIVIVKLSSLDAAFGRSVVAGSITGCKRITTVGGRGKIFLIRPDEFRLYSTAVGNKHRDVMLGVAENGFARREDILLNPSVIGG